MPLYYRYSYSGDATVRFHCVPKYIDVTFSGITSAGCQCSTAKQITAMAVNQTFTLERVASANWQYCDLSGTNAVSDYLLGGGSCTGSPSSTRNGLYISLERGNTDVIWLLKIFLGLRSGTCPPTNVGSINAQEAVIFNGSLSLGFGVSKTPVEALCLLPSTTFTNTITAGCPDASPGPGWVGGVGLASGGSATAEAAC